MEKTKRGKQNKIKKIYFRILENKIFQISRFNGIFANLPYSLMETASNQIQIQTKKKSLQMTINGISGMSCMAAHKNFNMIAGHAIDYMHAVLLGVMRQLLDLWLLPRTEKVTYHIKPKAQKRLDERILAIRPCSYISRAPRKLDDRSLFKANELRSLLLYYLPICLKGFLPDDIFNHFLLLSESIYYLLSTDIELTELIKIEHQLIKFVVDFQQIYGQNNVTMNVHLLLHLVESVRQCGPLWATSLFGFESNNGRLVKYVNGNTDILSQISTKYLLNLTFNLNNIPIENKTRSGICMKNKKEIHLSKDDINLLIDTGIIAHAPSDNKLSVFTTITKDHIRYTSTNYIRPKKTVDFFVKCKGGELGEIIFFFEFNNMQLMLITMYDKFRQKGQIIEVDRSEDQIIEANLIEDKMIFAQVRGSNFVVKRPNIFEKD